MATMVRLAGSVSTLPIFFLFLPHDPLRPIPTGVCASGFINSSAQTPRPPAANKKKPQIGASQLYAEYFYFFGLLEFSFMIIGRVTITGTPFNPARFVVVSLYFP